MKAIIKEIAYQIDVFKTPVLFHINQQQKNSTCIGSILSICIFISMIFSFTQSNMIQKTKPYINEKTLTIKGIPTASIGKNFNFIIGLVDNFRIGYFDKSIFSLEAFYYTINGTNISDLINLEINNCTSNEIISKSSNYFCLKSEEFNLFGSSDDIIYNTIQFSIRICNSATDNIICKSEKDIEDFMRGKYLAIFYPDYIYDLDDNQNPYSLANKLDYIPISIVSSVSKEIYYKKNYFKNDENWITTNNDQIELYSKDKDIINNVPINSILSADNSIHPLAVFYLKLSKNEYYINRQYQKLQEVLANLSGIANTLIFFGFFSTRLFSKMKMIKKIGNSLNIFSQIKLSQKNESNNFDYIQKNTIKNEGSILEEKKVIIELNDKSDKNEKKEKQDLSENSKNKSTNPTNNKDKSADATNNKDNLNKRKIYEFEKYVRFKLSQVIYSFSIFQYIKTKLKYYFNFKLLIEDILILKAEKLYREETDIIEIIKKLQEIEYLKQILLNPQQLSLFSLLGYNKSLDKKLNNEKPKEMDLLTEKIANYNFIINNDNKLFIESNFMNLLNDSVNKLNQSK